MTLPGATAIRSPLRHIRLHSRFYLAVLAAIIAFVVLMPFDAALAPIAAGDLFFAAYFATLLVMARRSSIEGLRRRARVEDEGIAIIVALTLGAIAFSFVSIFSMINGSDPPLVHLLMAIVSIPLGWLVLNALFASHYARLYYAPGEEGSQKDAGGLDFPDTPEPSIWDFWYFAFVIGATFQTSDVEIKTTDYRMVVLFHSIASFVFNTVLLALAVNIGASFAH